jgi:hypothetical protein
MSETVDERDRTLGVHDSNKENEVWYLVVRVMVATGSGNSWLFDDCSIKEMFEVKKMIVEFNTLICWILCRCFSDFYIVSNSPLFFFGSNLPPFALFL